MTDSLQSHKNADPIIITGGAQRLGLATAISLQKRGYKVVITYRKRRPLLYDLEASGIATMHADFSDEQGIHRLTGELCSRFNSVRAIIHNASEWLPESNHQSDESVMQRMLNTHVMAP
ncbi:MAG: dihydromonapterin reductase/dihydrofolate reductase, partial [Gammaproteobacteria bacterium]